MVESESTALPLGDAPKSNNNIISQSKRFVKYFFELFTKIFWMKAGELYTKSSNFEKKLKICKKIKKVLDKLK